MRRTCVDWVWRLAAAIGFWSFGFTTLRGGDLWWHLASGRLLLHEGMVTHDPWSYSQPGGHWIQHEWLADVVYALWVQGLGLYSLIYWKWMVLVATYLLLFETLRRRTDDPLSSFLAASLSAALAAPFLDLRPHLYTLLAFCLLLHFGLRERPLPAWLPLLFLAWVNLHAGVVFGLMVLVVLLWASPDGARRKLGLGSACAAATLLNPTGWHVLAFPFKYAFRSDSPYLALREWLGPFNSGALQAPLYPWSLGLLAVCLVLLVTPRFRELTEARDFVACLALVLLTTAMSLKSCRFIPLFGIALSLVVAPVLSSFLARWGRFWGLAALALIVTVGRLATYPVQPYAFHYLVAEDSFPVDTCDFLEVNQWQGNLFCYYAWGGYVDYRSEGRIPVFMDSRADTVFSDDTFRLYLSILRRQPGWIDRLEDTGAQAVLWPVNRPHVQELVDSGGWKQVHQDRASAFLLRADDPAHFREPPDSGYRQLALATLALRQGDPAEGRLRLEAALAQVPYLRSALILRHRVLEKLGEDELRRQAQLEAERYWPGLGR